MIYKKFNKTKNMTEASASACLLPTSPGGPGGPIGPCSPGIPSKLCLFVPCTRPASQRRPRNIFQYLKDRNKLIQEGLRMSNSIVWRKEHDKEDEQWVKKSPSC